MQTKAPRPERSDLITILPVFIALARQLEKDIEERLGAEEGFKS